MNKLLSYNPEPFESDSELEGVFQEYDAEGNGSEGEAEFEVGRSRSRSGYSRTKSARPPRVYAKPTRPQPRLKPDLGKAGLTKPPTLTSRLPFLPLKPPYHRFPRFPIVPPAWPLFPIPERPSEKPEPREPRGAERPGGEPSGGQPPEQEPREAPSEYVRWVQSCLNQVMGLRLSLDGIMNAQTRSAVRSFQERRGLPINGLVGPETERALVEICAAAGPPTPGTSTPMPFGTALELPWMTEAEWESGTVSRPRQHPPARPAFSTGVMAAFDSPVFRQKIVQIANQEFVRWGNGSIKETDPRVRRVIQDYWKTGTGNSYSEAQLGDPAFHKDHPWSAAFISWVMRTAGAGNLFKYSSAHAVYVKWAKENRLANNDNPFKAYRITESAPQVGDLVCKRRAGSGATYENIRPGMKTHCDIVTGVAPGRIITVGGNVDNSVAQKTIRTNAGGFLTDPEYFAVIRIGGVSAPSITPPVPVDWTQVSPNDRRVYVMRRLIQNYGLPENGAAGLVGNLWEESGLIPNRVEGSSSNTPMRAPDFSGRITNFTAEQIMNRNSQRRQRPKLPGIGLAQWTTRDRRLGLFQHSYRGQQLGAGILFHMDAQIDYLVTELRDKYRQVHNLLMRPNVTLEAASDEVLYSFEIPGAILGPDRKRLPRNDPRVQGVFMRRRAHARQALNLYRQAAQKA